MARKIGRTAVDRKQAACANIFPQMESIYSWKGQICEEKESVLILKTCKELVTPLKETVLALHEYECPCLVVLPIEDGHEAFLQWIKAQTVRA
ncbi:MAG: divalent-cation tolerance protein CutA [Bdellovibrionaceae bacterium]|nr:divalent-cation tolerance protein CutA [Pseudobdellovibrionaceae bacterium]